MGEGEEQDGVEGLSDLPLFFILLLHLHHPASPYHTCAMPVQYVCEACAKLVPACHTCARVPHLCQRAILVPACRSFHLVCYTLHAQGWQPQLGSQLPMQTGMHTDMQVRLGVTSMTQV